MGSGSKEPKCPRCDGEYFPSNAKFCMICGSQRTESTKSPTPRAKLPQVWECGLCTYENPLLYLACGMCNTPRAHAKGMSYRSDKLEYAGNEAIQGTEVAFAARMHDGSVSCWGLATGGGDCSAASATLKNVKAICASRGGAFAAILADDTVASWGNKDYGGDCSAVASELTQVQGICGSGGAFAALRSDGTVVTWGRADRGGDSSAVKSRLKRVKAIYSTHYAFAAVLQDGTVEAWGDKSEGGDISAVRDRLVQVECISGSGYAFAALVRGGTVVTWGSSVHGGNCSSVASELTNVVSICGSLRSFAALRGDGSVVSWGRKGECETTNVALQQVEALSATNTAFAARKKDGSVVTWGEQGAGGDCSGVALELKGVAAIYASNFAFAALKNDGSVVTWGSKDWGSDISRVKHQLHEIEHISSTASAFAARRKDGSVVTWGSNGFGAEGIPRLKQPGAVYSATYKEPVAVVEQKKAPEQKQPAAANLPSERLPPTPEPESKGAALTKPEVLRDGSAEFWGRELAGVVDEDDISEVATKLSQARFKQKHMGTFAREDLTAAGIHPAAIKDLLAHQHTRAAAAVPPSSPQTAVAGASSPRKIFPSHLPRIPETELSLEQILGTGSYSQVRSATWTRTITVGKQQMSKIKVAVKMSRVLDGSGDIGLLSDEMMRDLAVICGLPHQNILTPHGVCESVAGSPKIVYELMTTDLAKLLSGQRLSTHMLLRVLRDVSAGVAHLHSHGVIHRDLKPANVLLRDEQVKLCDFGSSRDLQQSVQQMSVAGTLDYMAPEVLERKPAGRPADVWGFGVLLFECVVGRVPPRSADVQALKAELVRAGCLPQLADLFVQCHQAAEPEKRPTMANIHRALQRLVMQEANDSQRLREELKIAQAQDCETYNLVWSGSYANQSQSRELLDGARQLAAAGLSVRQPLSQNNGKGTMEELANLANKGCERLHALMKETVEESGGTFMGATRKSSDRCIQKVQQEYDGDFSKLLDLERATGLFELAEDMSRCVQRLLQKSARSGLVVVRCKDRLNNPLDSGYRDILLNVCEVDSGFVGELQLNFHKIAQIKSQTHRFYELIRVMELHA